MLKAYLVSGNDEPEIKRSAQELVNKLLAENPDLELDVIDGDESDNRTGNDAMGIISDVVNSLQMDSLFGAHKLVWLKHCSFFDKVGGAEGATAKKGKGKATKSDLFTPLTQLIENDDVSTSMILVMDGPNVDRRRSFYKICDAAKVELLWYMKPDPTDKDFANQMRLRIDNALEAYGLKVAPDARECLKEILGSDSGRIRLEIEKLACYMGDEKKVTREDCLAICSRTPEALAWALTDALKLRDLDRSLRALDDLIAQIEAERGASSSPENALLAGVSNTFQSLAKARAAFDALGYDVHRVNYGQLKNLNKETHAGNFLLTMHPYVAFKTAETLRLFSDEELRHILHEILETNKALVSSGSDNKRVTLEHLIFAICPPIKP